MVGRTQWGVKGRRERQGRTRRFISTGYLSAALHLRQASGADKFHFHFSLCVNFSDGNGSSFYCTESLESIHWNDLFKRFVHRIVQCCPTPWTGKQPNDPSFSSLFSPEDHVHLLRDGVFMDYSTQSFAGDEALLWVVYMH